MASLPDASSVDISHRGANTGPSVGLTSRRWIPIGVIWLLTIMVYLAGAARQSSHLNLSATAGGQYPYLVYAKGMAQEGWLGYFGDRNRMPLYPALLSLVYDDDWSTFVARSRWFAIGSSLLFLAAAVATIYLVLPLWPATATSLMAAFLVFLPQAAFVQAELVYYALFLCSCVSFARVLLKPTWRSAAVAGMMAALTYLTKASGLALVCAFVLTTMASVAVSLFHQTGWRRRPRARAHDPQTYRRMVSRSAAAVFVFLALVYPYLATNKKTYGQWFYNVNSTFFMWCDSWAEAQQFASKYDISVQYPQAAATKMPSPETYWQDHTLRQTVGRLAYGFSTLGQMAWRSGYLKYLIVSLGLWGFTSWRRRGTASDHQTRACTVALFLGIVAVAYLLAYAWYVPVAFGGRFVLSLFLPATLFLWWVADDPRSRKPYTRGPEVGPSPRASKLGSASNTLAKWLIPVLLAEGTYAAAVRDGRPTTEFVRFYYNESLERLKMGDRDEAERGFRGVAQLDANMAAPRRDLGMIALSAGRAAEAVEWLEDATRLEPDHADGWNSLGGAYLAYGAEIDALAAFKRATELDAQLATAWYNLGGTCAQLGDRGGARAALEHLRALDRSLASQLEDLLGD